MNPTAEQKKHQVFIKTRLDAAVGKLPKRLEIIRAGLWENSWKGDLEILVTDLQEMKLNFDKGIGLPDNGSEGAPIDYSHNDHERAAAWIKALEVDEQAGILYASEIEWTPAGQAAVEGGEFKFFSPSVFPACLGSWSDPEDPTNTARNVLLGGGFTNIPFFKGLRGLKASQSSEEDRENVIYVSNEGDGMELTEVRAKNKEDLTTEEVAFLTEHKSELTADEQVAFGLSEAATPVTPTVAETVVAKETTEETPEIKEAVALQASIKSGEKVIVDAAAYRKLEASVNANSTQLADYKKKEVEGRVEASVKRGAIKADQAQKWTARILADASIEEILTDLPDNQLIASEFGKTIVSEGSASSQFDAAVAKHMEETKGSLTASIIHVATTNPDLANARDAEIKG